MIRTMEGGEVYLGRRQGPSNQASGVWREESISMRLGREAYRSWLAGGSNEARLKGGCGGEG
jgi:hypothetical protein